MEAVPRLHMLWFTVKSSPEGTSFGQLKKFIAEFYQEDPESYSREVLALETLRNQAMHPSKDNVAVLKRYYCQLHSLLNRFPQISERGGVFTFIWKDLYQSNVHEHTDVRYEMAAVMFNIAALHTQIGASVTRGDVEGMKLACTHFQCAAWAFGELREKYVPKLPNCNDFLTPELLVFMQQVSYAQAQECILEKSLIDNRKPNIVAKVTAQIVVYYGAALAALLTTSSGSDSDGPIGQVIDSSVYKLWKKYVRFKISYLNCILYLYQGQHAEEQRKMGERVTLFQAAWDKLEEARRESKGLPDQKEINESLTFTADVVEGKRKNAKNENEFIYHEAQPELSNIAAVQGANLVNGISFSVTDPEVAGDDIFSRLVPMKAHELASLYSEEKAKLMRKYGELIETKDTELQSFMSSFTLEYLNINEEKANKIPQGIVDRCAALNANKSAIGDLVRAMSQLAEICTEVETNLNEIATILAEEQEHEKEFSLASGVKRTPNAHIIELTREYQKYQEAHSRAGESNDTLRKAMELHVNNLRILARPLQEIQASVPKLSSELNTADIFKDVKLILNKINEMKAQRSQFHADLRIALTEDDITAKVIASGTDEGAQALFSRELAKHERLSHLIEQNCHAQKNILQALTDSYAKAAPVLKTLAEVKHKRDSFFSSLAASYDVYEDLLAKSAKGLEFYKKLAGNVQKLLTRLKSARDVQNEERQQHLKNSRTVQNNATSNAIGAGSGALSNLQANTNKIAGPSSLAQQGMPAGPPKLRDYLNKSKDSTSISITTTTTTTTHPPTTTASSTYIPLIRPNPLGSENPYPRQHANANQAVHPPNEPPPPYPFQQQQQQQPLHTRYGYTNPMWQQPGPPQQGAMLTPQQLQQQQAQQPPPPPPPAYTLHASPNSLYMQQQLNAGISNLSLYNNNNNTQPNVSQQQQLRQPPIIPPSSVGVGGQQWMPSPQQQLPYSQTTTMANHPNMAVSSCGSIYPPPSSSATAATTATIQRTYPISSAPSVPYTQPLYVTTTNNLQQQPQYGNPNMSQTQQQQQLAHQLPPALAISTTYTNNNHTINNVYSHPNNVTLQTTAGQTTGTTTTSAMTPIGTAAAPYYGAYAQQHQQAATGTGVTMMGTAPTQSSMETTAATTTIGGTNRYDFPIISHTKAAVTASTQIPANSAATSAVPTTQTPHAMTYNSQLQQQQQQQVQPLTLTTTTSGPYSVTQMPQQHQQLPTQPQSLATTTSGSYSVTQVPQQQPLQQMQPQPQPQQQPMLPQTAAATPSVSQAPASNAALKPAPVPPRKSSNLDLLTDIDFGADSSVLSAPPPVLPEPTLKPEKVATSPPASQVSSIMPAGAVATTKDEQQAVREQQKPQQHMGQYDQSAGATTMSTGNIGNSSVGNAIGAPGLAAGMASKASFDNLSICSDLSSLDTNFDWDSVSMQGGNTTSAATTARTSHSTFLLNIADFDPFENAKTFKYFHKEVEHYEKFMENLNTKTLNGQTQLSTKWRELQDLLAKDIGTRTTTVAKLFPEKNRSLDCLPYDHARVKLEKNTDDYINAAYVQNLGSGCPRFIIAQTPQQNTITDFWSMIWSQKSRTVLCLHTPNEMLDPYWPQDLQLEAHYDDYSVKCIQVATHEACNEYQLKLSMHGADPILDLSVLQIKTWTKGNSSSHILSIAHNALDTHRRHCLHFNETQSPLIINCLTGSERSGLLVVAINTIVGTQIRHPVLMNAVDVWYRIGCQRQNALRDQNTLEQSLHITLQHAYDVLNKRGVMTAHQMKLASQAAPIEKEETAKDPLNELDPLWKLK